MVICICIYQDGAGYDTKSSSDDDVIAKVNKFRRKSGKEWEGKKRLYVRGGPTAVPIPHGGLNGERSIKWGTTSSAPVPRPGQLVQQFLAN